MTFFRALCILLGLTTTTVLIASEPRPYRRLTEAEINAALNQLGVARDSIKNIQAVVHHYGENWHPVLRWEYSLSFDSIIKHPSADLCRVDSMNFTAKLSHETAHPQWEKSEGDSNYSSRYKLKNKDCSKDSEWYQFDSGTEPFNQEIVSEILTNLPRLMQEAIKQGNLEKNRCEKNYGTKPLYSSDFTVSGSGRYQMAVYEVTKSVYDIPPEYPSDLLIAELIFTPQGPEVSAILTCS